MSAPSAVELLLVSGLSGSGKTVALATLEDLGWFCIDNLPAGLLEAFVTQTVHGQMYPRIAVGIDARNRSESLGHIPQALSAIGKLGLYMRVLFLTANDEVIIKRYSESRRPHPLSKQGLALRQAISSERALLKPLTELADLTLDTSDMNVHQLRRRITVDLGLGEGQLSLLFESFAFKRGVPTEADFVFDARSLPNPHWTPELRPLTGRDGAVREYFLKHAEVAEFEHDLCRFLDRWLPEQQSTERAYVTVAIGCTGGRHRSVYLVEQLTEHFSKVRGQVLKFHREL